MTKGNGEGSAGAGQQEQGAPAPGGRTRRAKGEQTRLKILEAVLRLIGSEGTRGVTHRAVAREAGVQLSLTTYYFRDIEAMIREAFVYFSEHSRPGMQVLWASVDDYLDGFSAAELRRNSVREEICGHLAELATDYLVVQVVDKPVGLAVEQVFFTHARLSPELRRLGKAHRQQLLEPVVQLCARFNRNDPQIDAELLLDTFTALEYQALAMPPEQVERDFLLRLLRRHIGWVLGLKRA